MVSLIKNQILKHLSRFTKNLSPDKINLSTLKGEGELSSLELNEVVLTDFLELPLWINLTSAKCNKVSFRVQWTKLRSIPIFIFLDRVEVTIETCETLRSLSAQQGLSSLGTATEYGYISKVIDGITISVNSISITFKGPTFKATVEISKLLVESKSPEWKKVDLKRTRLKDQAGKHVLIFKELEWQSFRIQAKSISDSTLAPLILITDKKSRCRITIKKRISDCFVMGCRLLIIVEDLLWVLTDSQLKAVLCFAESLSGLIQKSNEISRTKKAARKLEVLPEYHAQISQKDRVLPDSDRDEPFTSFDFIETSYHFWAQKIDLHLSDDPGAGRSCHPSLQNGGAMMLQLCDLQIDFYPYHLAIASRSHWARYQCTSSPHAQWLSDAHIAFKNSLLSLLRPNQDSPVLNQESFDANGKRDISSPDHSPVKRFVCEQMAKIMTSCIIIRVEDFVIYRVVSSNDKQSPKEFIRVDRQTFPSEVSLHVEFTYFYYPGDIPFPLQAPKFYVLLNPVVVYFDVCTILWLNAFVLNLQKAFNKKSGNNPLNNYIDIKIEAIMPKVVLEGAIETGCVGQRDRPRSLSVQVSRALVSNVRSADASSRADLANCINTLQLGSLFFATDFPSCPTDYPPVPDKFIHHVQYKDNVAETPFSLPTASVDELMEKLHRTLLWTEARDVWCINLDPIWGEFLGARGIAHNKPVPFLDSFPMKVWLHMNLNPEDGSSSGDGANIHALAHIASLVSLQVNHYQFLFLFKLADEFTELSTLLGMDTERIKNGVPGSLVVAAVIPQVEVTLVMPSHTPGKESSGADAESVIPDTSSLADDINTNASFRCNSLLMNIQDITLDTNCPPSVTVVNNCDIEVTPHKSFPTFNALSNVKKGIASIIDSARKPISDDPLDSMSIRSDGSSDSENCIGKLCNPQDALFRIDGYSFSFSAAIEVASEVIEDDDNISGPTPSITTTSENPSNTSFYRRRDLISVATFKLGQVEFVQQSIGLDNIIKAHVSNIAIEECPAIPWDEFQSKFSSRTRGWSEVCEKPAERPRIRARFIHKVSAGDPSSWAGARNCPWFNDFLALSLANISLTINTPTISNIAELLTDDIAAPPLPADISLENVEVTLKEDKATSPSSGEPPVRIVVSQLNVGRGKDGAVVVALPAAGGSEKHTESAAEQLRNENEQLRRRLAAMERLNEENNHLRKCQEEIHVLRAFLNEAQDKVNQLLNEKENLLSHIKELKFSKGDLRYQNSGKR